MHHDIYYYQQIPQGINRGPLVHILGQKEKPLEQLQVDLDYEFFAIETAEAFSIVLSVYIFPSP
jgi:hypothetical protein